MSRLVFVTGGARSGKSLFALQTVAAEGGPVTFVATAEALDDEMRERVERHRLERSLLGGGWATLEAPRNAAAAVAGAPAGAVLLDCLSLLVSNVMLAHPDPAEAEEGALEATEALLAAHRTRGGLLVVVSNEVGSGVVPAYPLGRAYRDALGRANQRVAAASDEAYLLVAGLPLRLR